MTELHVKKQPLPVTLYLADGTVEAGTVFVSRQSAHYSGPETVEGLMEEPGSLLPFRYAGERFQLVGKPNIAAVQAVSGAAPPGYYERVGAVAQTMGGHRFDGHLLLEEGHGDRVSDAMTEDWPRIETAGGLVWLNRAQIIKLETR